ncbi:MAG: hypothetical protein JAZ02_04995 [Candidatus Thiodiazotropha endolucinida]|nr:hypothetical protein [Candidatus Thiodiazotropha sp. (ex Lucina pensylvanica)]MCG8023323.1 hypothetical protein [Candidatus Thiodiazotropha endolucinida]
MATLKKTKLTNEHFNYFISIILIFLSLYSAASSANESASYNCNLEQLPRLLIVAIAEDPVEYSAWQGREPGDTCDVRSYGVARFWSSAVRDKLSGSFWHLYAQTKPKGGWKHVEDWP